MNEKPLNKPLNNKPKHIINHSIKADLVRIQGLGEIMTLSQALNKAKSEGLDLILMNSSTNPPLCKIEDYSKFLYDSKKEEDLRKKAEKAKRQNLVELQFSPNISDNDFLVKLKKAKEVLEKGDKIKCTLTFKGREMNYQDKGKLVLLKLADGVAELGKLSEMPKLENKKMFILILPKKK